MEMLLVFVLCTASIAWILVYGSIFKSLREGITEKRINSQVANSHAHKQDFYLFLDRLFSCVGCMGVWAGFVSFILVYKTVSPDIIAYALSGALISLIAKRIIK